MKVCLIAEGSYPYVTGGVSSWIQMLINSMPKNDFIVFAIGAEEKFKGIFKYNLPSNLIEIKECFLDSSNDSRKKSKIVNYKIDEEDRNIFIDLITKSKVDWERTFSFINKYKIKSIREFLISKDFYYIVETAYKKINSNSSFIDFFWNYKSIIGTLLKVQSNPIPYADIYHSVSTGYAGLIGSLARIKYKKPFILTEHGIYTREREEELIRSEHVKGHLKDLWINYFYSISECTYKYADLVTTLFSKNKEIQMQLSCDKEKIRIIPNGVDIKSFENIKIKDSNDNSVNIGAIVRMVPIKDIKTMIQSFAIVKEEINNAKFCIIGPSDEDEEYFEECKMLVKLLELKDVEFTGKVNIKDYIGKMDVLVLTSISEGQPLAILEGMASKKPFVSTNVGCAKELLYGINDDLGDAGIICSVMDYESIGKAIITIVSNDILMKEMGQIGYERVNKFYSIDKFKYEFENIYNEFGKVNILI
ncbi:MAG: GT4 family glycosyltransferase PelF [Clostridiales bacterium]